VTYAAWLFSTCVVMGAAEPVPAFDATDRDAIHEVAFRALLKGKPGSRTIFFLGCDGDVDPSDQLIAKLADLKLRLRKASQAREGPLKKDSQYFDRETGEPGVVISGKGLRRTARGRAEIRGKWFKGGLNGFAETYVLEKRNGRWTILETKDEVDF